MTGQRYFKRLLPALVSEASEFSVCPEQSFTLTKGMAPRLSDTAFLSAGHRLRGFPH